ncbi:CYTH domain-containing protein [Candidatus Bealeia paramacronuclearis]|uniref:CYTH domain-containing protein n=1 Tax=Candidatus Bealeia paramacronuclearis TaxID=1921001 RepID=A0ABZ2C2A0_9PROT|nr:CYTH domain-containing protein [Candidatus Bealeia paramacronuclearis]
MFEVELKFMLTDAEKSHLLEGAVFVEHQNFVDVYYDDKNYSLSIKDVWLRTRNGKFVLKLPLSTTNSSLKMQRNFPKHEIENERDILSHFNILQNISTHEDLVENGIYPLYQFRNMREKYVKDGFIIDIDKAIFEDFIYETCEIELVVASESEIEHAIKEIEDFAKRHGIKVTHVEGRLIEYIRRKNPRHYEKLKKA